MGNGASRGSRRLLSWHKVAMLPGAIALAAGAALDLAYHLGLGATIVLVAALGGDDGEGAHWLLFAGMALVVAGLIAMGAGPAHRARRNSDASEPIRSIRRNTESPGSISIYREHSDREHSVTGG